MNPGEGFAGAVAAKDADALNSIFSPDLDTVISSSSGGPTTTPIDTTTIAGVTEVLVF